MIYPSAIDCLKTIESTLENKIKPLLSGTFERSTLATVGHLLRHVVCRIEHEGDVLFDDIQALKRLLPEIRRYAAQPGGSNAVIAEIDDVLARHFRPPGAYPSLTSLAEEAGALREALASAQTWLIATAGERKNRADCQHIREQIRTYIAQQLTGEALLVEPAFVGHGPRR